MVRHDLRDGARGLGHSPQVVAPAQQPAQPAISAKQARLAYDAALYAAAEEADLPPKVLRPIVAAILAELRDGGVTMTQAADVAKVAVARGKK